VAKMNERGQKQKKKNAGKSAFVRASESQLAAKFGSPVSITENKTGKGHLSIDFASPDELNRILDLLGVNLDD
ncbi:chromosome partitioning protein ParB, partial [Lactobacillus delbrueckii subsp. bulgaricus]|nr:chromosome partitioning protein ParB [Lactobacillus delbrueckii subsp. bulgaricus]